MQLAPSTPDRSRVVAVLLLVGLLCAADAAFAQDSDNDGLDDAVETDTGVFVSASDTGSDPLNFDTDGDGLSDGAEVNGFGSDPNASEASVVFRHLDAWTRWWG